MSGRGARAGRRAPRERRPPRHPLLAADALRGLSARTQFIVITHNRGTIEAADALYGVTVGEDSVSRVISLRLEEARAIAEQRAGRETSATLA